MNNNLVKTISSLESALSTAKFHAERLQETINCLKNVDAKNEASALEQRFINSANKCSSQFEEILDNNSDEMSSIFHSVYDAMDKYLNDQ
jgi:hypothetical protein